MVQSILLRSCQADQLDYSLFLGWLSPLSGKTDLPVTDNLPSAIS